MDILICVILWMVAIYLAIGLTATFFGLYLLLQGLLKAKKK
jgi:hypothetical protein